MSWFGAVPAFCIAGLVLVVPGLLASLAFRLRGFAVLGLAPAFSMSFIALASTLAGSVHLRWGILPLAVVTVLGVLVVLALQRLLRWVPDAGRARLVPPWHAFRLQYAAYGAGLVLAAALIGRSLLIAFVSPESFSQTYDNIFHLNALRYIQETGSASSLSVGAMAGAPFYPAGWHALVSLVQGLCGVSIPVAVNATNLAIGVFVWPVSVVALVHSLFGSRPLAVFSGALLAACFAAFPLLMVDFGVLYPNYLGLALLPVCLAQLLSALGLVKGPAGASSREWVMVGASVIGMSVAHPNSAMALLAFAVPLSACRYARAVRVFARGRRHPWRGFAAASATEVLFLVLSALVWNAVRPPLAAAFWPPTQTVAQAVGEGLLGAPVRMGPTAAIVLLVVVGIFHAVRRGSLWPALVIAAVAVSLYAIVSGSPAGGFRNYMTAVWYNDSYRLAAMLPMVLIPLAVSGVVALGQWWAALASRVGQQSGAPVPVPNVPTPFPAVSASSGAALGAARAVAGWRSRVPLVAQASGVAVLAAVLVVSSQYGQIAHERNSARGLYELRDNSPLVTSDELAILDRLDSHVPKDAVIAGSPYTGTALAYALADRKTLQLHVLSATTPAIQAIDTGLRDAPANAAACAAIRSLRVQYVLDFGTQEIHYENHPYHGVEDLQGSRAVQLIDQQGTARLYRVVACQG